MRVSIGVDFGGTNADAALYDCTADRIFAFAKVPTDHADYADTFRRLLLRVRDTLPRDPEDVVSINLSTTLSTNALLEGRGMPVNLVLIGFEKDARLIREIQTVIHPASTVLVRGGHTSWGNENMPLDTDALRAFASEHKYEMFAISALFSPRNPAHEIQAAEIVHTVDARAVSCGYEVAHAKLNAVKRTVTTYLNASLTPLIERFVADAEEITASFGFRCPLMFLKSDSTLVPAAWCSRYPIETIFSGPAASMRGAAWLTRGQGTSKLVVADIGGTSTDIGVVEGGRPVFSQEGATIGAYRTMIPSLEIHSVALGGDSETHMLPDGSVVVGPRRVIPFCRAQDIGPEIGEIGYTPTDAMDVLGLACVGDVRLAQEASQRIGRRHGTTRHAFATAVWQSAVRRLEESVQEVQGEEFPCMRAYVGAPGHAFADAGGHGVVDLGDAGLAAVASAVGAATSAVELRCEAVIVHSFADENYAAFLPHKKLHDTDFAHILADTEAEVRVYLAAQAEAMSIAIGGVTVERAYSYLSKRPSAATLASVTLYAYATTSDL